MDIKKFFENIDRRCLLEMLEKKIKDKDIIELCRIIIYSAPGTRRSKNKNYYPTANIYFDKRDKDSVIKDYNLDIKQSIELTAKAIL